MVSELAAAASPVLRVPQTDFVINILHIRRVPPIRRIDSESRIIINLIILSEPKFWELLETYIKRALFVRHKTFEKLWRFLRKKKRM